MNLVDNVKFNGNKLYDIRREKKISQAKLAKALNVSRQTIYLWETNQSLPSVEKVGKICKFLEINLSDLVDGVIEQTCFDSTERLDIEQDINKADIEALENCTELEKKPNINNSKNKILTRIVIIILFLLIIIHFIISTIKFIRLNMMIDKWKKLDETNSYYINIHESSKLTSKVESNDLEEIYCEKYYNNGVLKIVYRYQENGKADSIIINDYNNKIKYVVDETTKTYKKRRLDREFLKMTDNFENCFYLSNNGFINYLYCLNPFLNISYNELFEISTLDGNKEYIDRDTGLVLYKEYLDKNALLVKSYYKYELNTGKDFEINLDEYTDVTGQN